MPPNKKTDIEKIAAFQARLNEKQRIVHALAAKMLKTRYDPIQCNLCRKLQATENTH